jgi:hypothetical protein
VVGFLRLRFLRPPSQPDVRVAGIRRSTNADGAMSSSTSAGESGDWSLHRRRRGSSSPPCRGRPAPSTEPRCVDRGWPE